VYLNSNETRPTVCVLDTAHARRSKPSQGSIHAIVGQNNIKNKKGHHPNTPPLWEESRAQHCQAKRYS
jgi:uncharacterized short protein YbdD (DUF466 family)